MERKIKPLLAYYTAVDIPEVLERLEDIPCDKLYIKYYPYPHPHRIARDFFLAHPEYTHLIIQPGDLVATLQDYEIIEQDFNQHPHLEILSGVCNVDTDKFKDDWAACYNLPTLDIMTRHYYWIPKNGFYGIQRIRFAGFPFTWIKRQVIENLMGYLDGKKAGFDGTDLFGKDGYAADLWFAHACYHSNIPIYADSRATMRHLRFQGEMLVGKREPKTLFVSWDT